MIALLCGLALAQEPVDLSPPGPQTRSAAPVRRGESAYRAGMATGVVGAILGGVGAAVAVAGLPTCFDNRCGVSGIGLGGMVAGLLVTEIGAPIALGGAMIERRDVRERGGDPARGWAEAGWGFYAGQLLFSPLVLPGAYVSAAVQHDENRRADPLHSLSHAGYSRPCASRRARCRPAYGVTRLP